MVKNNLNINSIFKYFKIKTIVFDKTGTITQGVPNVIKFCSFVEKINKAKILAIIGTAEQSSEHPLGKAIVKYVKEELRVEAIGKCTNYSAEPGRGLRASVSQIEHFNNNQSVESSNEIFSCIRSNCELNIEETFIKEDSLEKEYKVLIGNRNWITSDNNIPISIECEKLMNHYESMGCTSVICAINGKFISLVDAF